VTSPDATPPSRATLGPRLAGIAIDWLLCMLISSAAFPIEQAADATAVERVILAGDPIATLAIWAVQHLILVATIGTTIGHRLMGLKVVREDGAAGPIGFVSGLMRTFLLALVIPAVVWDEEGRGLHDRSARTRIVRAR